jgi:hypothetical protein
VKKLLVRLLLALVVGSFQMIKIKKQQMSPPPLSCRGERRHAEQKFKPSFSPSLTWRYILIKKKKMLTSA